MIAIIAGTGKLPIEACKSLLSRAERFFVVCLFPDDNAAQLAQITDGQIEIVEKVCYKAHEILTLLKDKQTQSVLFIGKVDKSLLLKRLKLDWLAVKILGTMMYKSDKNIMEALLAELTHHGIATLRQDEVLGGLLVKPGILTGSISSSLHDDITIGLKAAQAIAHADIGQTVVVKDGIVIAVEAIEGTDACIKRAITLAHDGLVICKTARTDQNKKFDLPTLGPSSLASFQPGQISVIAWHAHCTLIAQKDEFIHKASELGIALVAVDAAEKT